MNINFIFFHAKVYEQVCAFLTIHDIMLLVYTLESLYHITLMGREPCTCISRIHGVIGKYCIRKIGLPACSVCWKHCDQRSLVKHRYFCRNGSFGVYNSFNIFKAVIFRLH